MSIKGQVIKESISRIEKRLKEVDRILGANPLSDIITLRQEVYPKIAKQKDITDPNFMSIIKKAASKEKRLFALAKKQQLESNDLITEKVKLESELGQLINERYYMDKSWITA